MMLRPVRTSAPVADAVTLSEAKAHLQVTGSGDDTLITAIVAAATTRLDGWAGILGRCLVNQGWRIDLACWPAREVRLPFPDVSAVSVKYSDAADQEATVDTGLYEVLDDSLGGLVRFRQAFAYPALNTDRSDAVRVTMTAGYGATADKVPAPIRQAILLSTQQLYGMRNTGNVFIRAEEVEGVGRTEFTVSEQAGKVIDRAVDALVGPYRRVGL